MNRPVASRCAAALAAVVLLVCLSAAVAPAHAGASVGTRITASLRQYGLAGSGIGVRVVETDSGRLIYARSPTTRLTPASNMKLVTSATALSRWGAGYRFRTELYLPPEPPDTGGVLRGDVYIKGYGDPTLSTSWFARHVLHRRAAHIGAFVLALRAVGITRIEGRIVADDTYFDRRRTVSTWSSGDWAYCEPLAALTVNKGYVDGRRAGDPPLAAARTLTRLVRRAGIQVTGEPRVRRVPSGFLLRYTEYSPPLSVVLRAMNKPSDNFFAETLTKGLGADFRGSGTTAAGTRVEGVFLQQCGIAGRQFRIYDGSGLSHPDKLTAAAVSRLLRVMYGRDDYRVYWSSLSVAGRDGTLADRMRGTRAHGNVHAKTGTLTGVSCLSGYVTTANGRPVVFSILMNRGGLSVSAAQAAQDRIAIILASSRL